MKQASYLRSELRMKMKSFVRVVLFGPVLLALSACGGGADTASLNELDAKIGGKNDADPALTAALEDQILVDPDLRGQANKDAIRPEPKPYQNPVPKGEGLKTDPASTRTLGDLAAAQSDVAKDAFNGCGLSVDYALTYAAKLPADMPLYPKSRVIEAAGSNDNGCKLRAVTHSSSAAIGDVAAHYAAVGRKAGYSVGAKPDGKGQLITGKRGTDGGAFYVILTPVADGTQADLVINNGR
jgi:hypothetical protein